VNTQSLAQGFYSISQAARLLDVPQQRLRGWVCGQSGAKGAPLIKAEPPRVEGRIALSFVNLIEAKFIATFASKGVSVLSMRYMAEEAQRFLDHPHPFATSWLFKTDGKKIFVEAVEAAAANDPCLYDLKGHNYAIHGVLAKEFKSDVQFSSDGLVGAWFPRKVVAPSVLVNPKISFGAPALAESGVPTDALVSAYLAEGEDAEAVARWFDVSVREVNEAVRFEASIQPLH
jgi:uncharacterized protein (DUF433 family)